MKHINTVGIFAAMHFLVDFICAFTMFGWFVRSGDGLWLMLLYNFCAFALQMPLGVVMDAINSADGHRDCVMSAASEGDMVDANSGAGRRAAVFNSGDSRRAAMFNSEAGRTTVFAGVGAILSAGGLLLAVLCTQKADK